MSWSARCAPYWMIPRSCRSCGSWPDRWAFPCRRRSRSARPCRTPPESEPKPVQAVFQQQPLPEPAAAMLRQAGKMDRRQEALLLALKPFLRKERQEKIDRALHAARLASLASLALKNRGRGPGAKETP